MIPQDRIRDAALAEIGLLTLRYDNRQVLTETESVVGEIGQVVKKRIPPGPLFLRGGLDMSGDLRLSLNSNVLSLVHGNESDPLTNFKATTKPASIPVSPFAQVGLRGIWVGGMNEELTA